MKDGDVFFSQSGLPAPPLFDSEPIRQQQPAVPRGRKFRHNFMHKSRSGSGEKTGVKIESACSDTYIVLALPTNPLLYF